MTHIDFYILESAQANRFAYCCRVIEKAWNQGHRVYIHARDEAEVQHLDRLLWTFRQDSFIPHERYTPEVNPVTPVLIGCGVTPAQEQDVLISLTLELPAFFSRFERLLEIVDGDEAWKNAARIHFRYFRDRGYPLRTHRITD